MTAIVPVSLSLTASLLWGAADFAGGIAARRASAFYVVAIAHATSLAMVLLYALASHSTLPSRHTLEFGLMAGIAGGTGLVFFFHALGSGEMGLTTSIAGVLTAVVPVLYSLWTEAPPAPVQLAGFAVAGAAIWMIASSPGGRVSRGGLLIAILSGIAFGSMLVLLRLAHGGALWPLIATRVSSAGIAILVSLGAILVRKRPNAASGKRQWGLVVGVATLSGMLDAGGNFLYTTSAQMGRLDVSAVLASLYPAVTILLAMWILKERATRSQAVGMGFALMAVVLISS